MKSESVVPLYSEFNEWTNVNKILPFLLLLPFLASCTSKYRIEGTSSVNSLDGKMLYLKTMRDGEWVKLDSAEVVHGLFSMKGKVDSVQMVTLYMDDESIMPFVIEKGKISISIDNARIVVTGTPLNDRLYDFVGKKTSLDDRAYELERQESRMIMDGKAPDEIQREITREREKLAAEMNALAKEFIQKNYDNVLGPGVFIMLCSNFPYPVMTPLIEEIIEEAPDRFKNNSLVKEYVTVARSNMEKLKAPH